MKSFLREMEEKFVELENHCEVCDKPADECECTDEVDEQNVTGAIAGYNTPAAFRKTVKRVGYASGVEESVNRQVSKTYKPGHYQTVEFDEEVQNDKFSFAMDDAIWWNKDMEYPSKDKTSTPGTSHKKDYDSKTRKTKLQVEDVLERKYEQLIEGYRTFATADSKTSPEQKVKNTIKEVAKKLHEIETMVNYNSRLKTESGVTSSTYGNSTKKALAKISERLVKISERVRALGE
jgi:hypothetical protein